MTTLETLVDLLPPPWTQHPASVVSAVLGAAALELDAGLEDVDRLRRSHGFDTAYRLGDLAKLVLRVADGNAAIEALPAPPGSVHRRCPDLTRLRELTGYEPAVTLEEGVRSTFAWYRAHGRPS